MGKHLKAIGKEQQRAAIFRSNFQFQCIKKGTSIEMIASDFPPTDQIWVRKWLNRLNKRGLARANSKTEILLRQLAKHFGLDHFKRLWIQDTKPPLLTKFLNVMEILDGDTRPESQKAIATLKTHIGVSLENWIEFAEGIRDREFPIGKK